MTLSSSPKLNLNFSSDSRPYSIVYNVSTLFLKDRNAILELQLFVFLGSLPILLVSFMIPTAANNSSYFRNLPRRNPYVLSSVSVISSVTSSATTLNSPSPYHLSSAAHLSNLSGLQRPHPLSPLSNQQLVPPSRISISTTPIQSTCTLTLLTLASVPSFSNSSTTNSGRFISFLNHSLRLNHGG